MEEEDDGHLPLSRDAPSAGGEVRQDAAAPRVHSSDVDGRGAVIACVVKISCLFWGSQQEVRPF